MSSESRKSAIRRVMRLKSWSYKTAAAFVDEQLRKIETHLDRFKSAQRLMKNG
jgi:hypothetical protein